MAINIVVGCKEKLGLVSDILHGFIHSSHVCTASLHHSALLGMTRPAILCLLPHPIGGAGALVDSFTTGHLT